VHFHKHYFSYYLSTSNHLEKSHSIIKLKMSNTLVILFFIIFNIIMHSAYGNTRTIYTADSRTSKQQNEPKRNQFSTSYLLVFLFLSKSYFLCQKWHSNWTFWSQTICVLHAAIYGMVMEPNKPGLHVAQAKGIIYKGPSNLNPRNVRGRSNCNSIKPSSLFVATLRNIIFILLLVPRFFETPTTRMLILTYLFQSP
jgi:hypothetical protein